MSTASAIPEVPAKRRGGPPKLIREKPAKPVKPFDGVPHIVQRLKAIRPGQSLRYYRGTAADLDSEVTPLHNAILHQVFACVAKLEKQGRVQLRELPVELKFELPKADGGTATVRLHMTDYLAAGLG